MRLKVQAEKLTLASALVVALLLGPAKAQFANSNAATINTVEQSRNARIGDRVSLTGFIKHEIRRAQYLLRDDTGEIRVRIEHEVWRGRKVTTKTPLNIKGRVQSDVRGRFIDAYYFQILEQGSR